VARWPGISIIPAYIPVEGRLKKTRKLVAHGMLAIAIAIAIAIVPPESISIEL
jgi:hypothetical protein